MKQKDHTTIIAGELKIAPRQIGAVAELLTGGATIPFIARYRKEVTGSLDEVAIQKIRDRLEQLTELDKRREAICKSLQERDLLTEDLTRQIETAGTMVELEDIYLPYRPKRRTRATVAKEKGLEPLAVRIFKQDGKPIDVSPFINPEKGVETEEDAWAGARDIIAEWISEDVRVRGVLRILYERSAQIRTKVVKKKETEAAKFRDYFDWQEPLNKAPAHRIHAILRGQNEGFFNCSRLP